jgi:hypothetical protein
MAALVAIRDVQKKKVGKVPIIIARPVPTEQLFTLAVRIFFNSLLIFFYVYIFI